jgi:hypothetical protein
MDLSNQLAQLFGIIMTILYGGVLLNQKYYRRLWDNLHHEPLGVLLSGFIPLLLGVLIVQLHNVWSMDWKGLITLLGWIMGINGAFRILFPNTVIKASHSLSKYLPMVNISAAILCLIGIYLIYMGFFGQKAENTFISFF